MAALSEGPHGASVKHVVLDVDGVPVDALHARPDAPALAGVALAPDIGGLRPLFEELCRRLATHGLAVCAVEPFARLPAAERAGLDLVERMRAVADLHDDVQLGDLAAAADHVEASDGVARTAVVGFCMGGYYALKAAATGRFACAVSFYGMTRTPEAWAGAGHRSPLDTAGDAGPTLAVFGGADTFTPYDDIDALRAAWRGRHDCKVVVYPGAEHGFVHDPDRPTHRPDDAADAMRRAHSLVRAPAGD